MNHDFYNTREYKEKQSIIMKKNWRKGVFKFLLKREKRKCARRGCGRTFEVKISDPKLYCSHGCSATINNIKRGACSEKTKKKISKSLTGRKNPHCGVRRLKRVEIVCANLKCRKIFFPDPWTHRKFCSNKCSMIVIGGRPTSGKAARGKGGIRKDIDQNTYFYSRWEANFARLLNQWDIKWIHQPKTFDLKTQTYTPDFYLPNFNIYIEIKNFLGEYSKTRDQKFRKLYPNISLMLLLKEDYLKMEKNYSQFIKNWEYRNSPFITLDKDHQISKMGV